MDAAAWVAVVAAAISLGGVIPAGLQVKSMKQQTKIQQEQTRLQAEIQKDSQRPFVWLDYQVNSINGEVIHLVLKNSGPSIASNIKVECTPPIERTAQFRRNELPVGLFEAGVTSMPPGREMRWALGRSSDLLTEGGFAKHSIRITFEGPFGPEEPLEYILNFQECSDQLGVKQGSLANIERVIKDFGKQDGPLKRIEKAITSLSSRMDED